MMKKNKTVMVFGVFDLLHPGHLDFLKQAKKLGDKLVVSVARDINVKKYKGAFPTFKEKERAKSVAAVSDVDEVILGGLTDPWPHIKKVNPDIIALGYDQQAYVTKNKRSDFKKELKAHGIDVEVKRLKAYRPRRFKTTKIKQRIKSGK